MKLNRWQKRWFKKNLPKAQYRLGNCSGKTYWYYFEDIDLDNKCPIMVPKPTYEKLPWYLRIL